MYKSVKSSLVVFEHQCLINVVWEVIKDEALTVALVQDEQLEENFLAKEGLGVVFMVVNPLEEWVVVLAIGVVIVNCILDELLWLENWNTEIDRHSC